MTPGEWLLEEFLVSMGLTRYRLAKVIGVSAQRIGEIVAGKRVVTADTDLRLCRFSGLSNGYWRRAQAAYDTEVAGRSSCREAEQDQAVGRNGRVAVGLIRVAVAVDESVGAKGGPTASGEATRGVMR